MIVYRVRYFVTQVYIVAGGGMTSLGESLNNYEEESSVEILRTGGSLLDLLNLDPSLRNGWELVAPLPRRWFSYMGSSDKYIGGLAAVSAPPGNFFIIGE